MFNFIVTLAYVLKFFAIMGIARSQIELKISFSNGNYCLLQFRLPLSCCFPLPSSPCIRASHSFQSVAKNRSFYEKNDRGTNHSSQFRRFLREAKLWNNEWNNNFTNIETISSWCLFHSCRHRTLAASSLWRRFFFLTQIHRNPIYGNLYDNHQILNALM